MEAALPTDTFYCIIRSLNETNGYVHLREKYVQSGIRFMITTSYQLNGYA